MNSFILSILLSVSLVFVSACSSKEGPQGADGSDRMTRVDQPLLLTPMDDEEGGVPLRAAPAIRYVATIDPPRSENRNPYPLQATAFDFMWDTKYSAVVYGYAGAPIEGALDIIVSAGYDSGTFYRVKTFPFPDTEFNDVAAYQQDGKTLLALAGHDAEGALIRIVEVINTDQIEIIKDIRIDGYVTTGIRKSSDFERNPILYGISGNRGIAFQLDTRSFEIRNLATVIAGASILDFSGNPFVLGFDEYISDMAIGPIFREELFPAHYLGVNKKIDAPARMVSIDRSLYSNVGNRLRAYTFTGDPERLRPEFVSVKKLPGRSNGLDAYENDLVLAQGQAGALYYDRTCPERPRLLGRFDFRDDRGSANNVKIGPQYGRPGNTMAFISDGRGGVRLIQISN
jgi:hypothetical protein